MSLISDPATLLTAFSLGFLGSTHCLGMCGGLASALGLQSKARLIASSHNSSKQQLPSLKLLLAYNAGRLSTYIIAGFIVGTLGFWLSNQLAALNVLRYLAATMLILMGLYIGQWFNGIMFAERIGHTFWRFIQPLGKRFIPVNTAFDALCVGLFWGWLPCGLVYSALIWASLEAQVIGSGLIMLCFGLGTLPSMLATGYFASSIEKFIHQAWFRSIAGMLMVLFGIWSMPAVHSILFMHQHHH